MGCALSKSSSISDEDSKKLETGVAPARDRKCRDVLCTIFFAVFWVGMVGIAAVGLVNGEPLRLLYGTDYNGSTCGTGLHTDQHLIYYPRLSQDLMENAMNASAMSTGDFTFYGVCVAACPNVSTHICNYEAEAEIQADATLTTDEAKEQERERRATQWFGSTDCWFVGMPTQTVFYRCLPLSEVNTTSIEVCIYPEDTDEYYDIENGVRTPNDKCQIKRTRTVSDTVSPAQQNPIFDQLNTFGSLVGRWIGDIQATWRVVLLCGVLAAFLLGFVVLAFLRACAGCVVWVLVWALVLVMLVLSLMLSTKGGLITNEDISVWTSSLGNATKASGFNLPAEELPESLRASEDTRKVFAAAAYVSFAITGILFVLVCVFQKKIRIAVAIIKEASRPMLRIPTLSLFPIIPTIMMIIVAIYSLVIGAYIYSSASIDLNTLSSATGVDVNATVVVEKVEPDNLMRILFGYHLFGFLWTFELIHAISLCTIAGVVCRYYWSREKSSEEIGRFPVMTSFKNCFRYHFGSLAFGSFIIALVEFIRAILMYIDHQTKDVQKRNAVARVAMKVVQCLMWCFEKCLRFLSKNAYILVAMQGRSFCGAAKEAFKLLLSNAAQMGIVSMISFMLLGAGKLTIAVCCAILAFNYIDMNADMYAIGGPNEISSPMAPILLTLLLAYFVASTFIGVYEMAIDTILLCYCHDKEINQTSGQYYMSDHLRKFVTSIPTQKASQEDDLATPNE